MECSEFKLLNIKVSRYQALDKEEVELINVLNSTYGQDGKVLSVDFSHYNFVVPEGTKGILKEAIRNAIRERVKQIKKEKEEI